MKRQYALPAWKWYDLLMMLGTVSDIGRMLEAKGYPTVPGTTIQGWRNRGVLPANWVPVFIQIALDQKIIKKIEDLKSTWDNP